MCGGVRCRGLFECDCRTFIECGLGALSLAMLDRVDTLANKSVISIALAARLGETYFVCAANAHFANATAE